jgi:hypothetical protein
MREVELVTFQAGINAGAKALMTAHTIFPAFDKEFPATLSSKILTDLLRGEMGFKGVIVSDAIGMAAILKKVAAPPGVRHGDQGRRGHHPAQGGRRIPLPVPLRHQERRRARRAFRRAARRRGAGGCCA